MAGQSSRLVDLFTREEDEADAKDSEIAKRFLEVFLQGGKSHDPMVLQNWFTKSVIAFTKNIANM